MTESTTLDFTMDPNLLVSVIKMQAGTLSKAILEGVMNSIDASATRVDVEVTKERFKISDNGRGFTSEEEIKQLFGRFGTPHVEGDAIYGRFRMGRGQLMSFAVTTWRSGPFEMTVDIEKDGLTYQLKRLEEPVKGCVIEGVLYKPMWDWKLNDELTELKKLVTYAPQPVYVNGELYGSPPEPGKWTEEDEDAYYLVVPGSQDLLIYNLGVFVESKGTWLTGCGGVVVSKKQLQVNFARNAIMEDNCPIWQRIRAKLNSLVLHKLSSVKALTDDERRYLAGRLSSMDSGNVDWRSLKLLTDPTGKHLALSTLKKYKRFVHIPDSNKQLGCAVHGSDGTFVVTDALLNRFSVRNLGDFLRKMESLDLVDDGYETIEAEKLSSMGLGGAKEISLDGLTKRESAAFQALIVLNDMLVTRLELALGNAVVLRTLRVGSHRTGAFMAWTNGCTYITLNRKYLKRFNEGADGVHEWLLTFIHEYMHDTDDSESHDHGEVFYRKFHDTVTTFGMGLASLARLGLKEYLKQLKLRGVPRPRHLLKQLRE